MEKDWDLGRANAYSDPNMLVRSTTAWTALSAISTCKNHFDKKALDI